MNQTNQTKQENKSKEIEKQLKKIGEQEKQLFNNSKISFKENLLMRKQLSEERVKLQGLLNKQISWMSKINLMNV